MDCAVLEKELAKYEAEKPNLLSNTEGRFVLIRDGQVIDTFDSFTDGAEGRVRAIW